MPITPIDIDGDGVVDLTTVDTIWTDTVGAQFLTLQQAPTGTGIYESFLRIQDTGQGG